MFLNYRLEVKLKDTDFPSISQHPTVDFTYEDECLFNV